MTKKLYFNLNPMITAFSHHAYVFGVINDKQFANDLVIRNYLQVYISSSNWFDFYTPDFFHEQYIFELKYMTIPISNDLNVKKMIVNVITKMIEKGYYITSNYNEFYIHYSWYYNKWDFSHNFLINGYDKAKKLFNITSFVNNKLCEKELNYNDFIAAYMNNPQKNELIFYKPLNNINLKHSKEYFKTILNDFINSKSSFNYGYDVSCFGISALYNRLDNMRQKSNIGITEYYVIYEHIKALKILVDTFCIDNIKIKSEVARIITLSEYTKNLIIKFHIKKNKKEFFQAIINIQELIDSEKVLINNILAVM